MQRRWVPRGRHAGRGPRGVPALKPSSVHPWERRGCGVQSPETAVWLLRGGQGRDFAAHPSSCYGKSAPPGLLAAGSCLLVRHRAFRSPRSSPASALVLMHLEEAGRAETGAKSSAKQSLPCAPAKRPTGMNAAGTHGPQGCPGARHLAEPQQGEASQLRSSHGRQVLPPTSCF